MSARRPARRGHVLRAAVAGGLFVYTVPILVGFVWQGWATVAAVLVTLGLCLPWLVSHLYPRASFAVTLAAAVLQLAAGLGVAPADLLLVAGVYNLGVRAPRRTSLLGAAVAVVLAAAAGLIWMTSWADLIPMAAAAVALVAARVWGVNTALQRAYEQSLIDQAEQLTREQAQLAQLAAAAERARIARDMHDVISHSLARTLTLAEGLLRSSTNLSDPQRDVLEAIGTSSRSSLAEVRTLLQLLRDEPTPAQPDTVERIEGLLGEVEAVGIDTDLAVSGEPRPLTPQLDEVVFRTVQESLTNVLKHARDSATRVEVSAHFGADELTLAVHDNGSGPSAPRPADRTPASPGYGLRGMRERVEAVHGSLSAGGAPGEGFTVRLAVPTGALPAPEGAGEDDPDGRGAREPGTAPQSTANKQSPTTQTTATTQSTGTRDAGYVTGRAR